MNRQAAWMMLLTLCFIIAIIGFNLFYSFAPLSETTAFAKEDIHSRIQQLDINTASAQELSQLPDFGDVIAQRIVDYRDKHGAFESIEDVMNVSGVGEKRMSILNFYCTVSADLE